MRQKVPLTAPGIVLRGSGVSVAANPTSSVPAGQRETGQRLSRGTLPRREELTKREGGSHEHGAHSLEAVCEASRVAEVLAAKILSVGSARGPSSTVHDDTDEDEHDDDEELEAGRPKLFFGVSQGTKDVDEDDEEPEDWRGERVSGKRSQDGDASVLVIHAAMGTDSVQY